MTARMYQDQSRVSYEMNSENTGLATSTSRATGVPAQKSIANRIPTNAMAVPTSGCNTTRKSGRATSADGASRSRSVDSLESRWESSLATARTVAILAISAGWKLMKPRSIQLLTPAAVPEPVPITSVIARSSTLSTYAGTATHSIQRGGTRASPVNAASASANQSAWRSQASSVTGLGMWTA